MASEYGNLTFDATIRLPQPLGATVEVLKEAYLPRGTSTASGGHLWHGTSRAPSSEGCYERGALTIGVEADGTGSCYTLHQVMPIKEGWGLDLPADFVVAMANTGRAWARGLTSIPALVARMTGIHPTESPEASATLAYSATMPNLHSGGDLEETLDALRASQPGTPFMESYLAGLQRDGRSLRGLMAEEGDPYGSAAPLVLTPRRRSGRSLLEMTTTLDLGAVVPVSRPATAYTMAWRAAHTRLQIGAALGSPGKAGVA